MTMLTTAGWAALVLAGLWPLSSVIAWLGVRPTLGELRPRYPWNWRILLGPWAYFRWLDRRRR